METEVAPKKSHLKTMDDRDLTWMIGCEYKLILTKEEWLEWVATATDIAKIVLDLETTGLNPEKDKLVGISLSCEEKKAIYIPILHTDTNFEDIAWILEQIQLLFQNKVLIAYNAKFDICFLQNNGVIIPKYEDCMISVYLSNANEKKINLKLSSKRILGIEMIELSDLFVTVGKNGKPKKAKKADIKFNTITSEQALLYACSDADITLRLYNFLQSARDDQKLIYQIENAVLPRIYKMENNKVLLDSNYFARLPREVERRAGILKQEILEEFGNPTLDILSPKQLSEALMKIGAKLEQKDDKNRNYVTDKVALEKVADQGFPIALKIIEYRQYMKAISTYFIHLYKAGLNGRGKFRLNQCATASGRFSSGKDSELKGTTVDKAADDGYVAVNVQNITANKGPIWFKALKIRKRCDKITGEALYEDTIKQLDLTLYGVPDATDTMDEENIEDTNDEVETED